MGVAAMSLAGGEYAIHGTNQPGSIGHFVSYGCIRMFNEDITDPVWPCQCRHPGGGAVIRGGIGNARYLYEDGVGHQEVVKTLVPDTSNRDLTIQHQLRSRLPS